MEYLMHIGLGGQRRNSAATANGPMTSDEQENQEILVFRLRAYLFRAVSASERLNGFGFALLLLLLLLARLISLFCYTCMFSR